MVVISACQSKCGEGCFKSNVDRQGKPTFALPTQIEQTRNARIIRTIGNGDWVDAKDDHSELERRLHNGMMSKRHEEECDRSGGSTRRLPELPLQRHHLQRHRGIDSWLKRWFFERSDPLTLDVPAQYKERVLNLRHPRSRPSPY